MKKMLLILIVLLFNTACDTDSIGLFTKILLSGESDTITRTATISSADQMATAIQKSIDAKISPTPPFNHQLVETFVYQTIEAMKPTATKTLDPNAIVATKSASTIAALEKSFRMTTTALADAMPPTLVPTQPKLPTAIPVIPTVVISPCDQLSFVSDITIPDGSVVSPGQGFQKIWRLRNTGSCAWSPSYQFVFVTGDQMGAPAAISLGKYVYPGETIDIAVNLWAPTHAGKYRGYWRMRNASGNLFGMGQAGHDAIWVDVKVEISIDSPPPLPTPMPQPTAPPTAAPPLPKKGCNEMNFYID